jgi:uncharacterized protein YndB with AHSA1/START domain
VNVIQKSSHVEVVVDASPREVWDVVSDPTRVGEWSHECRGAEWLGDVHEAVPGARFRGRNRAGWARWSRIAEIVSVDPQRELSWRTVPTWRIPDSTVWRLAVAPDPAGARITQSFQVVKAPRPLDLLFARLLPSHQDRDARLRDDLRRLGEVARARHQPV